MFAVTSTTDSALADGDREVADLIAAEKRRQLETLCLIPSENHVSAAVLAASGSILTNKYSEGYPGRRYYQGNTIVDDVETLATQRARALFEVDHANVQPLSGAPANLAVYAAFLQPGDTVMGMSLEAGGHLTHGWGVSVTGKWFRPVRYGVRRDTGMVDLDEVRELALHGQPPAARRPDRQRHRRAPSGRGARARRHRRQLQRGAVRRAQAA
jgi:glycine hydroxymethyltransferase